MRMLLQVRMDTAKGNAAVADGTVERALKRFTDQYNPEAAYFFPAHGVCATLFVFDMKDGSQIPAVLEPLWAEFGAEIELVPVMNDEDLQTGLSAAFAA